MRQQQIQKELSNLESSEYKKVNNNFILRNPSNFCFNFHETVKLWLCLLLRQEYGNEILFLATERKIPGSEDVADVLVYFRDDIVPYEIKGEITEEWKQKIISRDNEIGTNTKVIPISDVPKDFSSAMVALRRLIR